MKTDDNDNEKQSHEQNVVTLTPEEQAKLAVEAEQQTELLKSIKTKEQIQNETLEKLKATTSTNGIAVATALVNSIPTSYEKPQSGPLVIRKFEVTLYEEDEDDHTGQIIRKVVNGGKPEYIEAKSQKELNERLALYRQCGQIPVVKEAGPPRILDNGQELTPEEFKRRSAINNDVPQSTSKQVSPKIYKIGGIEIKNDNGKIYQKQWMHLSDSEAKNIRIVNDKTNGIVNLKGKHIEMMKWVLVENSEEDEQTQLCGDM